MNKAFEMFSVIQQRRVMFIYLFIIFFYPYSEELLLKQQLPLLANEYYHYNTGPSDDGSINLFII